MAVLFVELEKEKEALKFVNDFKLRTSEVNMVNNPFSSNTLVKDFKDKLVLAVDITPIYPQAYLFGLIPLVIGIVFNIGWLTITGFSLFVGLGFFWTNIFFKFMFIIGLKKNGYKSKVRFMSIKEGLRCFIWGK